MRCWRRPARAGRGFRALPLRLGVYFVLGLCLHAGLPYRAVLRELAAGLSGALAAAGWQVPASTALTRLRRRLGARPFELLLGRLAGPLSPGREPWSRICGLLAVAWDGTTVQAPASDQDIAAFGRPRGRKDGHYPQVRLVMLAACGTRALLAAAMGPLAGKGSGEQQPARSLPGGLQAGMVLLAGRNFYGYGLWTAAAGTGADLLWRVKGSTHLQQVRALPDGSALAHVNDPRAVRARLRKNGQRRRRGSKLGPRTGPLPGITVRVIEFWLTVTAQDGTVRTERYRLITTLPGHGRYPAGELAAGYAWRWATETGFREFKTYRHGPGRILRGRTPELARQELRAYLIIYQLLRAVIALAAAGAGTGPARLSFTTALHAVRSTVQPARTSPDAALASVEAAILAEPVPRREGRACVRAVWRPSSPFPSAARQETPLSQHAGHAITIRPPHQPPHTTIEQPRQTPNRQNEPP